MQPPVTTARDQDIAIINPITGQFDFVRKFNPDRIISHTINMAGNPLVIYDPVTNQYQPMDALVVTDSNGNVVTL